jgi:hypothetical protein
MLSVLFPLMSDEAGSARLWIARGIFTGSAQRARRPRDWGQRIKNPESPASAQLAVQDGEVLQRG